ncbi:ankyrin, partial [Thozetella sp. PMI_491]
MVTPLHKAAHAWNADGVEALLDLGANPTAADQCGRLPLHWAAMGRYLLDDYYSDGQLSNDSYGRFSVAWVDGMARPETLARLTMLATQKAAIRHLILRKASINKRDNYGRTPMHYAARMKLIGAVKLFLAHGADPTLSDMEGRTVLHELVHPFIGCFDHHGPLDRDIEDKELCSLLCVSVERADANHRDESGNTALHIATCYFSDTAVALLLHLGADPNFLDSKGSAPLHLAARRAMWRIHGMLIAAGADVGLRDR